MKIFLMLALSASALLASASVQAHTQPSTPKGMHAELVAMKAAKAHVVASPTAGGFRGSFSSSRPSYSGFRSSSSSRPSSSSFHSTPSYHSYSASPSRTFTFRSSSPSISTRPAITSRPTYNVPHATYSPPATNTVHHYQTSSGGGGMTATDYLLLNAAMNSGRQNESSASSGSSTRFVSNDTGVQGAFVDEDKGSGWQTFGICLAAIVGVCLVGALIYGLIRYLEAD